MELITQLERTYRKPALPQVQTGDTIRVHQLIKEGNKQRIQVFEGVVIRRHRMNELGATLTVRRIASGVGVEKTMLLHSPNVAKIEILRRAKVRRNFLSFLRDRRGKSARLQEISFDKAAANDVSVPQLEAAEVEMPATTDALSDAVSLDEVTKSENKAAAAQDEAPSTDQNTGSEATAMAEAAESGVAKADSKNS
jgi:large subunit ribosomal protein L19